MDIKTLWETIRITIKDIEKGGGDWEIQMNTLQAGIEMIFEFPPEKIVQVVCESDIPKRAGLTWLLYEGQKIREIDTDTLNAFRKACEQELGPDEGLLPFPPGTVVRG